MSDDISSPAYIGWRLEVFVAVFTALQIVFVLLRFYARSFTVNTRNVRPWEVDDWLIIIALLGQLVAGGIGIASVAQHAVGYHVGYLEETKPEAITLFFKYLVAISAWYLATNWISKLAICLIYWRLFPRPKVRVILVIIIGIIACNCIITLIMDLAACKPFSANWESPAVQAKKCIDKEKLFIWSTLPNIVTDVAMLALPLPVVWKLHTTKRMKGALTATFLVGSLGLAASICRFVTFSNTNSFTDATYNAVELIIWTITEPGIYLLSACMMMYRPLLEKLRLGSFQIHSSRGGSRKQGQSGTATESRITFRTAGGNDRGFELRGSATNGFEPLTDEEEILHPEFPPQAYQASHGGGDPSNIKITTNIRQIWEDRV